MTRPARCVDVVVPFYRERGQLVRAIRSCLLEGNSEFLHRVYAVCDGDAAQARWAHTELPPLDDRVVVLRTRGREGAGPARNVGLNAAGADIVAFLDADDQWLPHKLSAQLEVLRGIEGGGGVCGGYVVEGGGVVYPEMAYEGPRDVLRRMKIGTSTVALTRARIGDIRFSARQFSQDLEFFLDLADSGVKFRGLRQVVALYASGGRTSGKLQQLRSVATLVRERHAGFATSLCALARYALRGSINHYLQRWATKL